MDKNKVKEILNVSSVFASPKRMLLLEFFSQGPKKWADMNAFFNEELKIPTSVSEVYKHIHVLEDHDYVVKKGTRFIITKKGKVAIDLAKQIANTEPKIPRVEFEF
jgi:predicted transcriptional regulator